MRLRLGQRGDAGRFLLRFFFFRRVDDRDIHRHELDVVKLERAGLGVEEREDHFQHHRAFWDTDLLLALLPLGWLALLWRGRSFVVRMSGRRLDFAFVGVAKVHHDPPIVPGRFSFFDSVKADLVGQLQRPRVLGQRDRAVRLDHLLRLGDLQAQVMIRAIGFEGNGIARLPIERLVVLEGFKVAVAKQRIGG